ncbi:hypothetical protein ABFV70_02770 [Staphylococcus arlettae]
MSTLNELFQQLNYWKSYQPVNVASSILRVNKIRQYENKIRTHISAKSNDKG